MQQELLNWSPPPVPPAVPLAGRYVELQPLGDAHLKQLSEAIAGPDKLWDYKLNGPFVGADDCRNYLENAMDATEALYLAIRPLGGDWEGLASFMRINPAHGVIEIGDITFAEPLQRTRAASEALMLMIGQAFALGYRRVEWKCDARNLPSRRAAERLGFGFEGVFRQAMVIKGHNRDTAWFGMTDGDYVSLGPAYARWLLPENFDGTGCQKEALSKLTCPWLATRDPGLLES